MTRITPQLHLQGHVAGSEPVVARFAVSASSRSHSEFKSLSFFSSASYCLSDLHVFRVGKVYRGVRRLITEHAGNMVCVAPHEYGGKEG